LSFSGHGPTLATFPARLRDILADVVRRLMALLALAVALTACQLDVTVDVVVDPDGTGQIAVTIVADQEILDQIPTLAEDLVLADVIEAGWSIDGPRAPDDGSGGLFLQMTHPFRSQGEATNLLQSLGPPFTQMEVGRDLNGDVTTNQLRGRLILVDGFNAFADADLVAAVGSQPFAAKIAASGATPEQNMSITVRALLPGVLKSDTTNVEPNEGGILEWAVPLDGSALQWQAETTQQPSEGQRWARPLSIAALVALVGWVVFMGFFIVYVAFARSRRARAYKHRHL
jgi:hypothetical protein